MGKVVPMEHTFRMKVEQRLRNKEFTTKETLLQELYNIRSELNCKLQVNEHQAKLVKGDEQVIVYILTNGKSKYTTQLA